MTRNQLTKIYAPKKKRECVHAIILNSSLNTALSLESCIYIEKLYKGSDNKNGTGYRNGTNVNLYFFDIIHRFAVIISLIYNVNVY